MQNVSRAMSARLLCLVGCPQLHDKGYVLMNAGETAGPSRLLCKYQNCTNPSCPFRHENAQGSPIPPPALTARKAAAEKKTESVPVAAATAGSDNDDGDVEVVMSSKGLMDGALDDKKPEKSCRYGERCTRGEIYQASIGSS